jgi:hypothetical protein
LSLSQAAGCVVFATWVSICAVAPEFIWHGLVIAASHFSVTQAWSALFIGMLLAFFVEPLIERAKAGTWRHERENAAHIAYAAVLSLLFGVVAVGIHEAVTVYLTHEGMEDQDRRRALIAALGLILEWATIPLIVTVSWFVAHDGWRTALLAASVACLWTVATGFVFGWPSLNIVTTAVPCCVIAAAGCLAAAHRWDEGTFTRLAAIVAVVATIWLGFAALAAPVFRLIGWAEPTLYTWHDFREDARFYLGWAIGLAVAPNPVAASRRADVAAINVSDPIGASSLDRSAAEPGQFSP